MSDFRPAQLDIQLWSGNSWEQSFSLTLDNTPINLSSATVSITITNQCGSTTALVITEGDGITVGGVNNNVITVNKLITLAVNQYSWSLNVNYQSGVVKTYLYGDFIISNNLN